MWTQYKNFLILVWNLDTGLLNATPEKFTNIWWIEQLGKAWIHFLRDVFIIIIVLVAKAPCFLLIQFQGLPTIARKYIIRLTLFKQ